MSSVSKDRPSAIVLVVEDEPIQRMSLIDIIEEGGFQPVEAWDATSAVAILESRKDIRLVLSDIDMPGGMNGVELAALVRDRWPPIELILMSAGPAPDLSKLPARAIFLPKPLNAEHLLAVMGEMAEQTTA